MVDTKVGPLLERLRERVTRANPAAFAEVEQLDVLHHELEACSRAVTDADRHVADAISATRTRQAEIMFSLSELRSEDQWDAKTSAQRDACVRELTQVTEALNAELEKLHDAQIIAAAQVSTADDGFRAGCQRLADQLRAIASDPDAFLDPIAVLEAVVARGA